MAVQEPSKRVDFGLSQIKDSQVVNVFRQLRDLEVWSADSNLPDMALVRAALGELLQGDLQKVLDSPDGPSLIAVIAAWEGCHKLLKWSHALRPLKEPAAVMCKVLAAEYGHQELVRLLHSLYPVSSTGFCPFVAAAHEGSLQALKLLISTDPAYVPDGSIGMMACNRGHLEMVEWLITQPAMDIGPIARWACSAGSLPVLRMLQQHDLLRIMKCHDFYPLARNGDVQALQLLEQHICTFDKEAVYWMALEIIRGSGPVLGPTTGHAESFSSIYPKFPRDPPFLADHPGAIQWLLQHTQLQSNAAILGKWQRTADEASTIVLIQLAARYPNIRIPWSALTHSRAAAWGDIALLKWLAAEPAAANFRVAHEHCRDGRIMLLVHGCGWTLPVDMQPKLAAAEQRRFALASAVKQLRGTASHSTHLGHLPDVIIKKIGCMADMDFSWTFST